LLLNFQISVFVWKCNTPYNETKAMSSKLVIKFLIKIRDRTQKINSIFTQYRIYGILKKTSSKYYVYSEYSDTPVFDPKTPVFDPLLIIFISFVSFVICFVFRKIWFWSNTKNAEYGINRVLNFEKVQNLKKSVFRRA